MCYNVGFFDITFINKIFDDKLFNLTDNALVCGDLQVYCLVWKFLHAFWVSFYQMCLAATIRINNRNYNLRT